MGINLDAADIIANIQETADAPISNYVSPIRQKVLLPKSPPLRGKNWRRKALLMHDFFANKNSSHTTQGGVEKLPGVKNIIAVASAKGGVGKSTTAANIALALAQEGGAVGILDADIYGPSFAGHAGCLRRPQGGDTGGIAPVMSHGIALMSIGFMVGEDQPMVWRGPMATRALVQLLRETHWGNLDYLILDMPPGTGDIQLTIAQQIPVTGAIVVTTPQELAVSDARRGLVMFGKVSIPVLGVVENMGVHHCPHCGHDSHIFGSGGAQKMCARYDVELLGELPLDAAIRDAADGRRAIRGIRPRWRHRKTLSPHRRASGG